MHKFIITSLFVIFTLSISAQIDTIPFQLENVVIQSNRIAIPFSDNSRTLNVISNAQIEATPAQSVPELLQYVAGIDIRQRGVHGVQADASIRGGTFEQVLILVNGIKMVDPQTGHHALNIPVDVNNIERIEILKGPGARIYGQNAFAGAINIITKKHKEQEIQISLDGGENSTGGFGFAAALPKNNASNFISFNRNFSEGYKYNTDYNITNLFYQSNFSFVNKEVNIMAGFTEKEFGANGFYASPDFMDQYEAIQTSIVALEYNKINTNSVFKPRIYWRRNQDEYVFVRNNPSIYRNLHINNTIGMEINTSFFTKLGMTGFGIDLQTIQLQSNNLGAHDRQVATAFFEHRFQLFNNHLDITPGISYNYYSDFESNFLPGVDFGFRLGKHLRIFANAGYTYRIPSFTDLFYEDPANIGNENLQPESAFTYEGGIKFVSGNHSISASYFNREGEDMIDWTKNLMDDPWQPQNFQSIIMRGADASLQIDLSKILPKKSWIQLSYTYIDAQLPVSEVPFSRYALENLQHQAVAGVSLNLFSNIHASFFARYNDRVTMDDYTVLDAKLTWESPKFTAYVKANNLTDEIYRETNLVEMPGRWIMGGLKFRFKY